VIFLTAVEELQACLSGELEGWMGARSWLGAYVDYGAGGAPSGGDDNTEPTAAALHAARVMDLVERTLRALPRSQAEILVERYRPRGPYAPLGLRQHFGELAPVVVLLASHAELAAALLEHVEDEDLRRWMRPKRGQTSREGLDALGGAELLRFVVRGATSSRDLRRLVKSVHGHAGAALQDALVAYREEHERQRREGRERTPSRAARLRAALGVG